MVKKKYHVYLTAEEYRKIVEALVFKKNELTATARWISSTRRISSAI